MPASRQVTLGVSCFYHDSAAALVVDGVIIAAAQEERFSRIKGDASFPTSAMQWCLDFAGIAPEDVSTVAFYEEPQTKCHRILDSFIERPPSTATFESFAESWLGPQSKLAVAEHVDLALRKTYQTALQELDIEVLFVPHHVSHAASAFLPSPYESAAIIVMDSVGEWSTTSIGVGSRTQHSAPVRLLSEIHFPHSLGVLYSGITSFLGFKVNSGEYKVMGLAPFGRPRFASALLDDVVELYSDGSFRLNADYFQFEADRPLFSTKFEDLFGVQPRVSESNLSQAHFDIAASVQDVLNQAVVGLAAAAAESTERDVLCIAGGVGLNCVANSHIVKQHIFREVWVQPAATDSGGALGAALYVDALKRTTAEPRPIRSERDPMGSALLGPEFSQHDVQSALYGSRLTFTQVEDPELFDVAAQYIASGLVVGWFQGRMEFGPRALGNRSILADPRSPDMQRTLNQKIKFRESFRPFAPSVLAEEASDWFNLSASGDSTAIASPYMLFVGQVRGFGSDSVPLPAITHVDGSARYQTVTRPQNPRFHALLSAFGELTGVPVLINTSFNVRGEPIVCTPEDAIRCFLGTNMDVLCIENFIVTKEQNPQIASIVAYANEIPPD